MSATAPTMGAPAKLKSEASPVLAPTASAGSGESFGLAAWVQLAARNAKVPSTINLKRKPSSLSPGVSTARPAGL